MILETDMALIDEIRDRLASTLREATEWKKKYYDLTEILEEQHKEMASSLFIDVELDHIDHMIIRNKLNHCFLKVQDVLTRHASVENPIE